MMDPINPWIDLGETRRLAERLMSPSREPVTVADPAGFGDGFVGFSDPPNSHGFADPVTAGAESASTVASSPGNHVGEWDSLRDTTRSRFSPLAMFLFDAAGECVFSEGGYEAFHFVLRDLVAHGGQADQNRRIKVGAQAMLEVLPIRTEAGIHWLGVVLPCPMGNEQLSDLVQLWAR